RISRGPSFRHGLPEARVAHVGWVERSETHHSAEGCTDGFRLSPLPIYDRWMVLFVGKYQSDETVEWM
ncbi:MAG: hypothetical protein MN733_24440, partial [Nitrososphaera sp.]|nr:hypothetical protein [Nitrososphaera sp.]